MVLLIASPARGEEKSPPGPLSADEMSAATDYIIPPAADVFNRLSRAAAADWKKTASSISEQDLQQGTDRSAPKPVKAFNLGRRVADAFIALQAEDSALLRKLADVIEKLGADLNASDPILNRGKEARRLVEDKKWVQAGAVLATMRSEVIQELAENKDRDSVVLATLGGWLRGLQVVSSALAERYDADASKVLRDPMLIQHLQEQVNALGPEAKGQPFVTAFMAKAEEIKNLVSFDKEAAMSEEAVAKLAQISNGIMQSSSPTATAPAK
jgi:nucleotide-binding universal stress UspA family protein